MGYYMLGEMDADSHPQVLNAKKNVELTRELVMSGRLKVNDLQQAINRYFRTRSKIETMLQQKPKSFLDRIFGRGQGQIKPMRQYPKGTYSALGGGCCW